MSVKQLAAITVLLLVAGCSPAPVPTPVPAPVPAPVPGPGRAPVPTPGPAPAPAAPIALKLSPESGAPGTTVAATLRVREPDRVGRRGRDGSFLGWVCFQACAGGGATASTTFRPSQAEPGVFTGLFTVPLVLGNKDAPWRFDPLAAGEYQVHAACVLDQAPGCGSRAEVSATFRTTRGLETVAWQQLPAAGAAPMPRLGAMSAKSRSPLPGSQRTVECVAGNFDPRYGQPPPKLLLTDDAGRTLPPIIFSRGGPLIGRHDYANCADVALDPSSPDVYYVLEAPHAGGAGDGAFPSPKVTRDRGATWAPVPAPEGFEARKSFVGFTGTADGVTAWFSRASLEEPSSTIAGDMIQGSITRDGGKSWTTVEPACPGGSAPCLRLLRDLPPWIRNGLINSTDGGKSWSWAAISGIPFATDQVYVLNGSDGKVLEAVGASPMQYFGLMPLLRTEDGGATWRWVAVPPPPGDWTGPPGTTVTIQVDPDGALAVGRSDNGSPTTWHRLARGSTEWAASSR